MCVGVRVCARAFVTVELILSVHAGDKPCPGRFPVQLIEEDCLEVIGQMLLLMDGQKPRGLI